MERQTVLAVFAGAVIGYTMKGVVVAYSMLCNPNEWRDLIDEAEELNETEIVGSDIEIPEAVREELGITEGVGAGQTDLEKLRRARKRRREQRRVLREGPDGCLLCDEDPAHRVTHPEYGDHIEVCEGHLQQVMRNIEIYPHIDGTECEIEDLDGTSGGEDSDKDDESSGPWQ